ncbi:hypothetical protein, partial [Streptomyces sp. UNC401CLCol]|uniref:hypothetical protein n=1 Tax=Streptomyces sp. UNC401CLCol TaxID=1449077 RepID=UPI001F1FF7DC
MHVRRISSDSSGSTCRTARASTIAPTVRLSSSTVRSRASSAAADGGRAAPWGLLAQFPAPLGRVSARDHDTHPTGGERRPVP